MIISALDIHGRDHIINVNYVTHIEHRFVSHSGFDRKRNPCAGTNGDARINIYMTNGKLIEVSCDHDGDDISEGILINYKRLMISKHGM